MKIRREEVKAVMILGVLIALLLAILILLAANRLWETNRLEIREDRLIVPEATEVPAPEEAETGEAAPAVWTRYPVPLDDELQIYIEQLCAEYEVPANVVFAVIEVESGYDPSLVGDGGNSWGLMQIYATQHTARCVRLGAWNLLDPRMNVRVGIDFLGELLAIHDDIEWALSWYNGWGGEPCDYAGAVMCIAEQLLESSQQVTA